MSAALPEVWLRGPIEGVPRMLQPVAHSLLQCREEVTVHIAALTPEQAFTTRHGAASAAYHVQHAAGSLDRLFTYARDEQLSESQLRALRHEGAGDPTEATLNALVSDFAEAVDRALAQLRATSEHTLLDARGVGRARLPSTVIGLLFHAAEHTQRHIGQMASTVKILRHASGESAAADRST